MRATILTSLSAFPLLAQAPLETVRYSADVAIDLSAGFVGQETVVEDDLDGNLSIVPLDTLPPGVDLNGYHLDVQGNHLLTFNTTATLPGDLIAEPADVVLFDGSAYSLVLDSASHPIPQGAVVDAASISGEGHLLISFDLTVALDGETFDSNDLALFDGAGFSVFFDASNTNGLEALDLDAAHYVNSSNKLLLSFDGTGLVDGIAFDDESILEFNMTTNSWTLLYEPSETDSEWPNADLDALFAAFGAEQATVLVSIIGEGSVTSDPPGIDCPPSCEVPFDIGTEISFTASPSLGSVFLAWSGDADCADGELMLSGEAMCTAQFEEDPALLFADGFESGSCSAWSMNFCT